MLKYETKSDTLSVENIIINQKGLEACGFTRERLISEVFSNGIPW